LAGLRSLRALMYPAGEVLGRSPKPARALGGPRKGTRAGWRAIPLQSCVPLPARHAHNSPLRHAGLLWTRSGGGSWGCTSVANGCVAVVAPGGLLTTTTQALLRCRRQARSHMRALSAMTTHTPPMAVGEPARSTTSVAGIDGDLARSPSSPHDARSRASPQPALRSALALRVSPLRASAGGPHPPRSPTRPPLSTHTTGYAGCTTPLPTDRDATRATPPADPPPTEATKRSRYRPRARRKGRGEHSPSADRTGAAAPPAKRREHPPGRATKTWKRRSHCAHRGAQRAPRCARPAARVPRHATSRPSFAADQPARTHGSGRAAPAAWPVPARAGRWGGALNGRPAHPPDRRGRHDALPSSDCGHSCSGRLGGGARGARTATGAREPHSSAAHLCIQWREHTGRPRTRRMHLRYGKRRFWPGSQT